ncbi:C6 transcription factor [Corynespora cassiicola Philippines]|uniref:C6 transcription factor n=1 Tax=Corynespora cassiicola Philippines TaxID=1448308 RepID=A0A2T2NAI0_CORCC|nr:C6 transcription factor [Corynespora cassiicola Philippines]
MKDTNGAEQQGVKKARTRSGCLNCKSKRRKCDEIKPVCARCNSKGEKCEWGSRIIFRAENNHGVTGSHLSGQQRAKSSRRPPRFEIKDVTAEVIRDYQHYDPVEDGAEQNEDERPPTAQSATTAGGHGIHFDTGPEWHKGIIDGSNANGLSHLQQNEIEPPPSDTEATHIQISLPTPEDLSYIWPSPNANGLIDDSIFLPGSAYLDAHSTLRSHLYHEVRSNAPTRHGTPEPPRVAENWPSDTNSGEERRSNTNESDITEDSLSADAQLVQAGSVQLSEEEEFTLWKNWLDEVAPWLDKFDSQRHFQHTLPIMARSHEHLRYSILAVSARQLERKEHSRHTERSLALYQMAIHLVLPQLHTRSTAVIASCVVLCVLEMLSSAPKAWRQHLDGCAHLIEASGINGFMGGIDQALFWCFARMDVCGGLIASMKTLIPVDRWVPGVDLEADVDLFRRANGYDAHACHAVYLCAQALDLLAFRPHLAERVGESPPSAVHLDNAYASRWTELWRFIEDWHSRRPPEMLPISSINSSERPFPMVLYSNPAAISGNQLYHTASILMMRHKPSGVSIVPKPRSIFWHARQICAISISNDHHGAWTNSIQPIWIAGQWMSHPTEQKAILELYERIETETGWGTKWRAEDLKEFWG